MKQINPALAVKYRLKKDINVAPQPAIELGVVYCIVAPCPSQIPARPGLNWKKGELVVSYPSYSISQGYGEEKILVWKESDPEQFYGVAVSDLERVNESVSGVKGVKVSHAKPANVAIALIATTTFVIGALNWKKIVQYFKHGSKL